MVPQLTGTLGNSTEDQPDELTMSAEELYAVQALNPAYQHPDRRGRAQATRGYTRRSRVNWLTFLRS